LVVELHLVRVSGSLGVIKRKTGQAADAAADMASDAYGAVKGKLKKNEPKTEPKP
jgi:hypothetical protein